MNRYLFYFGYCTPEQWKANDDFDLDDESSAAFFVMADSTEAALRWGNEVAEFYVAHLFACSVWSTTVPSWKVSQFANWIEDAPESRFSEEQLSTLPLVSYGEMPSIEQLASTFGRSDHDAGVAISR